MVLVVLESVLFATGSCGVLLLEEEWSFETEDLETLVFSRH